MSRDSRSAVYEERGPDGQYTDRPEAHSQVLRENQGSGGNAEPDRGSEGILRPVPDGRRAKGWPARRRLASRLQIGFPDFGLFKYCPARVREVHVRAAEIRRGRVPPAGHDLRCAAESDAAP